MAEKLCLKEYIELIDPSKQWKLKKIVDSDRDLPEIAKYITEWETKLAVQLHLTETEISDIKKVGRSDPTQPIIERKRVLHVWKGNAKANATYESLLMACLAGEDTYTAEKICALIQSTANSEGDADSQKDMNVLSSDSDHSDQSSSASSTPPVKHKKPSTSTRQHKRTHKHKVLDKHKKSKKRQRVVSSSSPSSTSSSATSSDSDHMTTAKKNKKKVYPKKHSKKVHSCTSSRKKRRVVESALMRYANQYLKPYYQKDSIARDDKLSMNVCSEFIKLALIPKDKTKCDDDVSSKASLHFSVDKNLEAKTPLGLNEVITSDTKFVLVEGPPGFGKTTLSWELCRRWDTFSCLKHYKIILLLKLREPGVHNATSLNKLFSIYYVDKYLCKEAVGEALESAGKDILFIFDGFDELPSSVICNDKSLIMKLINGSCLPCATRVVTSRPSALHYNKHFPAEFRHIEILGFTDECKERFAEIAFKSEPDLLEHFKAFMVSNPIINSLMYIPFNCAILAQVYKDIRNSRELMPETMTNLYTILTKALILGHMTSSGKWDEDSSELPDLNHLSNDISTDFKRVCELAYEGLFKEDVQLEFSKSDVGDGFQHLGLMTETKERNMGVTTSYSFPHLSIQEFLAAWHVSCHSDLVYEAFSKIVSLYGDITPHLRVFGQFLCGIIGYYEIFIHKVIPDLSPYILHCLYEIKELNPIDIIIPNLHLYTPLDMYVFGYCLVRVPIQCQSVVINTSLKMLLHSLSEKTNGATLGTINDLCIFGKHTSSMKLTRTKYLPKLHVKSFSPCQISSPLVPVLAELISVSSGLTLVDLSFSESCENDYLLFQSIQHIANLETFYLTCCTLTQKGVQELSKIITTSSTLTSLRLELHPLLLCEAESSEEHKLLVSVLSTSFELYSALIRASTTISILHTNIPCITNIDVCFLVFSSTYHLHPLEVLRYFRYSSCNVEMNSIESLAIPARIDDLLIAMPQYCCNLIMGLNDSLHLNHSIKELTFKHKFYLRRYSSFRDCIARALRRDPAVPRHNLRRSQSLCDLRTLHFPHRHQLLQQQSISSLSLLSSGWRHISPRSQVSCYPYQSCPNLLEMQALKNMHPLLQEALGYNELSINEFYLHYCYP